MAAKRGGKSQAKRGGGLQAGLILVAGLALGIGLAAGYLMFGDRKTLDAILPQPNPRAEAPAPRRDAEPLAQEPETPAGTARPTYDFYTVLPEKAVELPGEAAAAAGVPRATTTTPETAMSTVPPTAPTAPTVGLQLQAGAFGNAGDAEALRARLALVGQMARIETIEANGRTLHRVRLGPYADVTARDAAQAALAEAGITTTPAR